MGPWEEWRISEGWANRSRTIIKEAVWGGKPCQGDLLETRDCSLQKCPSIIALFFYLMLGHILRGFV